VHGEHLALCLVQPGEDEDLVADGEVADACFDARVEHQPRRRRSLEALLGRGFAVAKG
jgi:hypothetical protein